MHTYLEKGIRNEYFTASCRPEKNGRFLLQPVRRRFRSVKTILISKGMKITASIKVPNSNRLEEKEAHYLKKAAFIGSRL